MTTSGARLVEPLPLSKRKYLANFLGRAQGKVGRLQLIELAKKFPAKVCLLFLKHFRCCLKVVFCECAHSLEKY